MKSLTQHSFVLVLVLCVQALCLPVVQQVQAAPAESPDAQLKREEAELPKETSSPPRLARPLPTEPYHCQRLFVYRGRTLPCDSNLSPDAENLRPLLREVPESLQYLDEYQSNRRWIRNLAYVGSVGFLLMGAGLVLQSTREGLSGVALRNTLFVPGVSLLVGSIGYGLILIKVNESKISKAVETYNKARPQDRIELQFSTGLKF